MSAYRFNRHELFTAEDRSEVLDLITQVENAAYANNKSRYEGKYGEVVNMLFGMFDGYLYDNIVSTAVLIPDLDIKVCKRIEEMVDKITQHLLTKTQIEVV